MKNVHTTSTLASLTYKDVIQKQFILIFFKKKDTATEEEEEVIRCVCNIFRDEGLMLQCEKCEVIDFDFD